MSTIKANTLLHSDGTTTNPPAIPALDQRMAKAWVSFQGTGSVSIKDSYNVSSITDGGTGTYQVNYTNALTDTNYAVTTGLVDWFIALGGLTTTYHNLYTFSASASARPAVDVGGVYSQVFGS